MTPEELSELIEADRILIMLDQLAQGNSDKMLLRDFAEYPHIGRTDVRCQGALSRRPYWKLTEEEQLLLMRQMLADNHYRMVTYGEWFNMCDASFNTESEDDRGWSRYMEDTFGFPSSSPKRFRDDPNDPRYLRDEDDC